MPPLTFRRAYGPMAGGGGPGGRRGPDGPTQGGRKGRDRGPCGRGGGGGAGPGCRDGPAPIEGAAAWPGSGVASAVHHVPRYITSPGFEVAALRWLTPVAPWRRHLLARRGCGPTRHAF
ncbi:hypothetical protein mvi_21980 [Methylobacterium indicum]|uniref:Uncharacterized protein n=1 Tax=Methylobacterium indicum TaxID=1775910 RepID=A0A8H8WSX9_9HYPH|nr:hypothetical protein mvi_21980 [Methylobacterium indicum]